jgi:hypothetical protein
MQRRKTKHMKKILVIMAMGFFLVSCRQAVATRVVACAEVGIVGASACINTKTITEADKPVREKREPVILLRILTEL